MRFLTPAGEPAGVTEVATFEHRPWFVQQQGTTTLGPHRNRGLGRWLKAEMFDQLRRHHPEAQIIETGNADSNAPMLTINEQMGFRPHVELTVRQAPLDQLLATIARRESGIRTGPAG